MALTNIEYGSIASSAVINNNFSYLDTRISDSNSQTNTSISSILSNIATINSRLNQISESFSDAVAVINNSLADYKSKVKLLVKNSGMVPNWGAIRNISVSGGNIFQTSFNGYVFVILSENSSGNISINGSTVMSAVGSGLKVIPVKAGDSVSVSVQCNAAYFVPAAEISVENF